MPAFSGAWSPGAAHAIEAMLHGPVGGRNAIEVAYQPIVDLERGVVAGYEALARFPEPARSPLPWFELARELGHHDELEAASLAAALTARRDLPPNTFLTVNLGPDVLTSEFVREVWRSEPSLGGVVVELTENVRVESFANLAPSLDELRSRGALLAIDDTGAGYAGLQHLLGLRPDIVKLDRSLVSGVDRDEAKRALIEMMGAFSSRIDAWVLAEGVETEAELDVLTSLGVPLGQGFFLGRPGRGFADLDPGLSAYLHGRATARRTDSLREMLEPLPVAADLAEARSTATPGGDPVAVVDTRRRPVALVDADGVAHGVGDGALRFTVDTPVTQAVQRAMVRPPRSRFLPLVCVDDAGRFVGIARVERLVERLTRTL